MDRTQLFRIGLAIVLGNSALLAQPARRVPLATDEIRTVPTTVEKPEPHVPKIDRSEFDLDRLHSAALFAEGRIFFQRERFDVALQKYQRAYHYTTAKDVIAEEIIPLAYRIGRSDEAVRYLMLSADQTIVDPFVVRRLAIFLTEQGQLDQASQLYERIEQSDDSNKSNSYVVTQFEMGRLYFLQEDYEKAAPHFQLVAQALKSPAEYHLDEQTVAAILQHPEVTYGVFAETFMQVNDFDLAKEYFRRANQQDEKSPVLQFELARVAERQKDYATARQHLTAYIDAKATDAGPQPYYLLFKLLRAKHTDEPAARKALIENLQEQFSLSDSDVSMGYVLAEQLLLERKTVQARDLYKELMRREPLLDGFIGLAKIALFEQDAEKFLSVTSNAVAATGEMAAVETILEDAADVNDFATAVVNLALASTEDSPITIPLVAANLAMMSKQFEAADKLFANVVAAAESAKGDILAMWGVGMMAHGKHETAARVFQRAIDENLVPERLAEWHFYLSGNYSMLEKHELAIESAEKCAELSTNAPGFEIRPAWILYLCDEFDRSRTAYEQFLKKWSDDYSSPQIRTIVKEARLTLSTIYAEQSQLDEAVESLELVLDEFPNDVGTMNDLGYLWADKGEHLERAQRMIRIAVDANPTSAAYRDSLGWVLYRMGRYEEAVTELQTATELGPPDAIILDHLGDALLAATRVGQAADTWRKALEAAEPDAKVHSQIKQKLEQLEVK